MSYLLTYVQRAGVVSMLLIGGVLAEMIPLYSGAQALAASTPHLYIEVYLGTSTTPAVPRQEILLGSPVSCTSTAYNYCFPLTTAAYNNTGLNYGPAGHQFRIADMVASTNPARVNINDKQTSSPTNPSDTITVTGMKLLPTTAWSQFDVVTVKLIVTHKFDAQPNAIANGTSSFYVFGMSVGGQYNTSPSPAGNFYQMYGRGVFTGTSTTGPFTNIENVDNPHADFPITRGQADPRCYGQALPAPGTKYPLCQYIAGADSIAARFNSSQDSTNYPGGSVSQPLSSRFPCNNNLTGNGKVATSIGNTNTARPGPVGTISISYNDPSCQPYVEETHKFSITGPDEIWLTGSSHAGGGICGEKPLPSCQCDTSQKGKKDSVCNAIEAFIELAKNKEIDEAGPTVHPVLECTAVICSGRIDVTLAVNQATTGLKFPFIGLGPGLGSFEIETTGGTPGQAIGNLTDPFVNLITGHGGAEGGGQPLLIMPDYDNPAWPKPASGFYAVDQMLFESANGSTIIGTDTFVAGCKGDKGPGFVFFIGRNSAGQGDSLILRIHIHTENQPGSVCPF